MNEKMREVFARREFGCEGVHSGICFNVIPDAHGDPEMEPFCDCPTYDSRDDLQRIIDGLSINEIDDMAMWLVRIMKLGSLPQPIVAVENCLMLKATVEQIQEALLRALGEWE